MSNKLDMKSMDVTQNNISKIKALFPSAVTEVMGDDGKVKLAIDFDALKQELSADLISEKAERYQMTWPDKSKAKVLANSRITATLRPDKKKSVDFDNTENLYIEGDNLDVLKLLRETYLGKVKMIYIDPPYNTGNDFVYNDDFAMSADDYDEISGQYDEQGNRLVKNLDSNGRFHTDWLNMIYPRLKVARDLLTNDGIVFISIDDNEADNLRKICDELFGESNFIAHVIHKNNSMKNQSKYVGVTTEFVLIYCKNIDELKQNTSEWRIKKKGTSDVKKTFSLLKSQGLPIDKIHEEIMAMYSRPKYSHLGRWNKVDENGVFTDKDLSRANGYKDFTIVNPNTGKPCSIPNRGWGKTQKDLLELQSKGMIWYGDDKTPPREKSYLTDEADSVFDNYIYIDTSIDKKMLDSLFGASVFEFPKPVEMISTFLQLCTSHDDIILDFFSGSATTAHAVMQMNAEDGGNRKFIVVQLPEKCDVKSEAYKAGYKTICDIGEERIRRAGKKIVNDLKICGQERKIEGYTLLRSGYGGAYQYAEWKNNETGEIKTESRDFHEPKDFYKYYPNELDIGFRVLKLDSSNMQEVYYNPSAMTQDLLASTIDNVKTDRTPLDLLFQVMLDRDIELSAKIDEHTVNGKTYYAVNENDIIACFDNNIDNDVVTAIAKQNPRCAVFKDKSFATDSVGINNEQLFKTYSPSTVVKVI